MSTKNTQASFEIEKEHLDQLNTIVISVFFVFSISGIFLYTGFYVSSAYSWVHNLHFIFSVIFSGFIAWSIICFKDFFKNSKNTTKYKPQAIQSLKNKRNILFLCLFISISFTVNELRLVISSEALLSARILCSTVYFVGLL